MAKEKATGLTSPVTAPIKKPLSKLIHNRGKIPVVIRYIKGLPEVLQVNRKVRLKTEIADKLLTKYKDLKEVKKGDK